MATTASTLRVGKRYRYTRLDQDYDAIVIGSGIGGLTSAACLSKMGKKVCVLEQHYTAGGFTHSYERNGYEWDVGVHYIGDMGHTKTTARRLFDYITNSKLKWSAMDKAFDRIFIGKETFNLNSGKVDYRQGLIDAFPEEEAAIDEYLKRMHSVKGAMQTHTLQKILPTWVNRIINLLSNGKRPVWFQQTTREVLEDITDNQMLIALMTSQWGDCGMPPAESSFVIHSLIAQHYMHGGFYPIGGAAEIARTIIPIIQASGGEVFTYASVEKIFTQKKTATGVLMADGNTIKAPIIISNAGVFNTFTKLLDNTLPQVNDYQKNLTQVTPSMGSICLYIGIQDSAENLSLPKTNFWIYPDEHYEQVCDQFKEETAYSENIKLPMVYISFPSAKDPDFSRRYPGRATIEIVAPCRHEWFSQWKNQPWGNRGEDYEALKQALSRRLLKELYDKLPQLHGKIDYYELSTTLSTDFFCRYPQGEIYGIDHDPQRFEQSWLKPKTTINGLYLTGQDIVTCGVVGAMMAGLITSVKIGKLQGLKLAKAIFFPSTAA